MPEMSSETGYARLTPRQARLVMIVLALSALFFVGVTFSPLRRGNVGKRPPDEGDVALYWAEVQRIHAGEGYYQAAAAELPARGYPTRSLFNWRTPLPMWLIGKLPAVVLGKALICGAALALLLIAFEALAREENNIIRRPVACALLLTGPLMPCLLGNLFVMPVLWAGVFIALSICAYGIDRPWLGVAMGLAALFLRELALPYCLLAAAIAWWHGRRAEGTAWGVGLAAWLGFFALHGLQVARVMPPNAVAHSQGWIQLGGAGFVIATAQMNAYLVLLPQWITALYLVAALFAMAGWHTELGLRCGLTTCLFVTAFALVGQEFNQYWGSLFAPLLCLGIVRFPASLRDLYQAARRPAAAGWAVFSGRIRGASRP